MHRFFSTKMKKLKAKISWKQSESESWFLCFFYTTGPPHGYSRSRLIVSYQHNWIYFLFILVFKRKNDNFVPPPQKNKINSPINLWKIPKQNKIIILLSGFDKKNQHIVNHRKINKGFMIDLFIYIRNIQNIATFECNDEYSLHCMPTRKFCCHENYITIHIHI